MGYENEDSSSSSESNGGVVNLYSVLKLDQDASPDEIHRAYRLLSNTFHPDKLPSTSSRVPSDSGDNNYYDDTTIVHIRNGREEEIQQTFLDVKRAHEILIDPVLRLTYDHFGEDGVSLIRKVQQQQREQKTRREASVQRRREDEEGGDDHHDDDHDDDDDEGDDDYDEYILYDRIEGLLKSNQAVQALEELARFIEQYEYHRNLSQDNQVQLNLSMEFPPVADLATVIYGGREYLQYVQKSMAANPPISQEEREYYVSRFNQERRLVEYQINKISDAQKANLGFTLTSVQPRNAGGGGDPMTGGNTSIQSKWSMAMGANTSLVYPQLGKVGRLAGKKEEELHHPISMFVNTSYQPNPHTQINLTANLSSDESHQFVLGSSHTFTNLTAVRYNMTLLSKSPLNTPLVMDLKTYRHLRGIGMASGGISMGADGRMFQWNALWEAVVQEGHRCSVKASVGVLQGNSVELSYRARVQKTRNNRFVAWLDEHIHLPKRVKVSTLFGRFTKVTAMVIHECTTLAMHPTIGFGMEHNISLGGWTWVWEIQYHNSTFRIPVPVIQLGSVSDPGVFYARQLYHATYCLLLQSIVADILHDHDEHNSGRGREKPTTENVPKRKLSEVMSKTRVEAQKQLVLMDPIADKKRILESQRRNGLVIIRATYWYKQPLPIRDDDDDQSRNDESANGRNGYIIAMDATKQIQFWVSNGTLSTPSDIPKSSWMGFYDLRTEISTSDTTPSSHVSWTRPTTWEWKKLWRRIVRSLNVGGSSSTQQQAEQLKEPQLTVRYSHLGYVYEVTVGEREALVLPDNPKAQRLGDANFVQ